MSVKENLIAARALIDTPEKWGKGDDLANGGSCVMLACSHVGRGPSLAFEDMRSALIKALPAGAPLIGPAVVRFNDHPDTTHADIMALFDRAITACDEQVAA